MVRIAVIGAGIAGIITTKACIEEDFQVIVYEMRDSIGGVWRYNDDEQLDITTVANSTVTNTSKEFSAFSDFPPPDDFPNYMHHTKTIEYIEMYGKAFNFSKYVKFCHEIVKCEPSIDYNETGRWTLTILDISTNNIFNKTFDGIAVCIGHYQKPNIPTFKDQHLFKGIILHTNKCKIPDNYKDKSIVIIGMGNSAVDSAVELSTVAKNVYLSTRSGAWILKRVGIKGLPIDLQLTRLQSMMSKLMPNCVSYIMEKFASLFLDHTLYQFKPNYPIIKGLPIVNDLLPFYIISGKIKVKKNIERFTENGVIFEGDNHIETQCDVILMATGFVMDLSFISNEVIPDKNILKFYKFSYDPNLAHPKTLCMIGLNPRIGPTFPMFEIESRMFALLMANKIQLPSHRVMIEDIQRKVQMMKTYKRAADYVPFMDEIAEIIGVMPNLWKYFFTDNKLWRTLIFGPFLPYQYRLRGPHSWSDARHVILTANDRIKEPFKCA